MSERHASPVMVTVIPVLSENPMDYTYGVVTDGEKVLVVCTEGVSWWVTDEKPWPMGYPGGKQFGISREDLISMVAECEDVYSLDKFIRSFGSRLECNFRLCENAVKENMFHGQYRTERKIDKECDICREMAPLHCDAHVDPKNR